jgi:hypothetical protein
MFLSDTSASLFHLLYHLFWWLVRNSFFSERNKMFCQSVETENRRRFVSRTFSVVYDSFPLLGHRCRTLPVRPDDSQLCWGKVRGQNGRPTVAPSDSRCFVLKIFLPSSVLFDRVLNWESRSLHFSIFSFVKVLITLTY